MMKTFAQSAASMVSGFASQNAPLVLVGFSIDSIRKGVRWIFLGDFFSKEKQSMLGVSWFLARGSVDGLECSAKKRRRF